MYKKFRLSPLGKSLKGTTLFLFGMTVILSSIIAIASLPNTDIFLKILYAFLIFVFACVFVGAVFWLASFLTIPRKIEVTESKIRYRATPFVRTGKKVFGRGGVQVYLGGNMRNPERSEEGSASSEKKIKVTYVVSDLRFFEIRQNALERLTNTAHISFRGKTEVVLKEKDEKYVRSVNPPAVHVVGGVILSKEFMEYAKMWTNKCSERFDEDL